MRLWRYFLFLVQLFCRPGSPGNRRSDLQHLMNDLQRKGIQQAIAVLDLDHRYHQELKRQLQLMTPSDLTNLGEGEKKTNLKFNKHR